MPDLPPQPAAPPRVGLTRNTIIGLGIFGVLMIGLLMAQLALLRDQQTTTDAQLRTAVRQANASLPLLEDAQPLVEKVSRNAPAIQRLGRRTNALLTQLTPLTKDLRAARADEVVREVGALSRTLLSADLPASMRALDGFLGRVRETALVQRTAQLAGVVATDIAPDVDRTRAIGEQTLRLFRESVAIQRETLAIARQTNAAAQEAARRAASIDNKTGGELPPTGAR